MPHHRTIRFSPGPVDSGGTAGSPPSGEPAAPGTVAETGGIPVGGGDAAREAGDAEGEPGAGVDGPPPTPRPERLSLQTHDQWSAFCSGVRLEILTAIHGLGEASIAEVARAIDRSADGLYRHIRILEAAGLIESCDVRRVGRQTEAVYRPASRTPVIQVDPRTPEGRDRVRELLHTVQREGRRAFETALEAGELRSGARDRNSWVRITRGWLDEDDLRELDRMIEEMVAFFAARQERRPGRLHQVALVASPLHRDRPFAARGSRRQERMLAEVSEPSDAASDAASDASPQP